MPARVATYEFAGRGEAEIRAALEKEGWKTAEAEEAEMRRQARAHGLPPGKLPGGPPKLPGMGGKLLYPPLGNRLEPGSWTRGILLSQGTNGAIVQCVAWSTENIPTTPPPQAGGEHMVGVGCRRSLMGCMENGDWLAFRSNTPVSERRSERNACLYPLFVHTLLISAALLMSLPCSAEWVTRHHNDTPWDTTSDPADLDAEVAAGARILRFADGSFVHALHRQYPQSCGPSCLAIMLRSLGFDDPSTPLRLPANVDRPPGLPGATVDVGHVGSMEHLLWLGYHRHRLQENSQAWNADAPQFMSPAGDLNVELSDGRVATLWPDGALPAFDFAASGRVPNWLWYGPGNGTRGDDNGWDGLPGIMNYIVAGVWGRGARDARPLTMHSRTDDEVCAARRITAGFIHQGLPILLGVESGGHFNVIVGYRGEANDARQPFVIYGADPLDGWGRPAERLPGRWRRMSVTAENLFDGGKLIYQAVLWNQTLNGGCEPGGWASEIDRLNGNDWLCGRPVPPTDPLHDPLALRP